MKKPPRKRELTRKQMKIKKALYWKGIIAYGASKRRKK